MPRVHRSLVSLAVTVSIAALAVGPASAATVDKKKPNDTKGQLPRGHYTGIIRGTIPFEMAGGGGFSGSGSAVFTGTLDVDIAKKGSLTSQGTFSMKFQYKLQLPPNIPAVAGSDVNVTASGDIEGPATLTPVNLDKQGFTMVGDIQGAGSLTASASAGGVTGSTSSSASGSNSVTITFKAQPGGVTCSRVPAGTWSSPTVDGLAQGLTASGWQVDFQPKKLRWNLKADEATQKRLDHGACDNFVPAPLTKQ